MEILHIQSSTGSRSRYFYQALKGWFRGLVHVQALTLAHSILLFMKQPEADR